MSSLIGSPWAFAIVALSVLLDVFLPVLPSGVLLISAATAQTTGHNAQHGVRDVVELLFCAAVASCLGDLAAYRLAWHSGPWFQRRMRRTRRWAVGQERIEEALAGGGGSLVLIARFAPAGRSVMAIGAGAARRRAAEFLPWSALAGMVWAASGVSLGYLGGQWLGATWLATGVSVAAFFGAGLLTTVAFRREQAAVLAPEGPTETGAGARVVAEIPDRDGAQAGRIPQGS
ncbi:VTT domain-containing protein [Streptomyces sp. NPDC052107]|uniref:DedA family protein n=1 Tax=Streptomyces sp. NPDC052107 TaxID=3155632 RepID=UPI00342AC452